MSQLVSIQKAAVTHLVLLFIIALTAMNVNAAVTLTWERPTTNADGTPCDDLAGYKFYYDTDAPGAPHSGTGLDQGDSPIIVPLSSLTDPDNPELVISGLNSGVTYHLCVTAYDLSGNESALSNEITAMESAANRAPNAHAGADQQIHASQISSESVQVDLDGTASSDADGDPLSYNWTQTQGGPVNLMGSTTATPFFSATTAQAGQTLVFQLVVHDGQTSSQPDSVSVTVAEVTPPSNVPPVAIAGGAPTRGEAPLTVNFSGSGSDTDGSISSYRWNFGDGSSSAAQNGAHKYNNPGTYTATLTVTDNQGAQGTDTVQIIVEAPAPAENTPPRATANGAPTQGQAPLTVNFSGSGSDEDGSITSYRWDFGDGDIGRMANTEHMYMYPGTYTITLTVTDNQGATGSDSLQVVVTEKPAENVAPTVSISADPVTGMAPLTVDFAASASDSDGTIVASVWNFGDSASTSSRNTSHTYTTPGNYTASFTATDNDGAATTRSVTIQVNVSESQDTDDDGIPDVQERAVGLNPEHPDSDGDGIPDLIEWGPADTPVDTDDDGTIDALDADSDGDGVEDRVEGTVDTDGDGALNYVDSDDSDGPLADQDGDGVNNSTEVTYMMNPNAWDTDKDGIDDGAEFGLHPQPLDSDGDDVIDALDHDSDNDGKPDTEEGTGDVDQDGAPNWIDSNDNDGPAGDQDQDGFTNMEETRVGLNPNRSDSDGDGIPDSEEVGSVAYPSDSDSDGIPDALDTDSDNDGIADAEESREDMDGNNVSDRKEGNIGTFNGKQGRMAVKLTQSQYRLTETRYIQEAVSAKGKPNAKFSYGGLKFKIKDVPVGGSVDVEILSPQPYKKNTQYWKYDETTGYSKMESTVSGNRLTFRLTDGGTGDADYMADGKIDDPGFIVEPEGVDYQEVDFGGGSGCRVNHRGDGSTANGLVILLPLIAMAITRVCRKIEVRQQ